MSTGEYIYAFASLLLALLTYVTWLRPCRLKPRARYIGLGLLLLCGSRMLLMRVLGGSLTAPNWPGWLLIGWGWAFSALVFTFILSVLWPFKLFRLWGLPLIAGIFAAVGVHNALSLPVVEEVSLGYADLPPALENYRIVQITDMHVNPTRPRKDTQAIVDQINALQPDLICLTGDFVDGFPVTSTNDLAPVAELKAKDGVWAVRGNHEYYHNTTVWTPIFNSFGVHFLENTCVFPRPELALGGVNDPEGLKHGQPNPPDIRKAFAAATNGQFRVLMCHRPDMALEAIEHDGVRLQLSGHTHGGLMPIIAQVTAFRNRGFVKGLYRLPHGYLYDSPGLGQWSALPMRWFDPPEISVITLHHKYD